MILTTSRSVSVSGSIGENQVTIYGYTSPNSRVEIDNANVYALTYSRADGYFEFDHILLPKNPSDLCLHSQDEADRLTPPICIPPPPPQNYHTDIGPVILPPSLTISSGLPAETPTAAGQSLPNSPVQINFYQTDHRLAVVPKAFGTKAAHALSLPTLQSTSDATGNFSLNLPNISSTRYRLYATTSYQGSPSPKSNTLTYALPGQFNYLILLIPFFFLFVLVSCSLFFFRKRRRYLPTTYPKFLALVYKK